MTQFNLDKGTEFTVLSNDSTVFSQQQLPTVSTNPITARVRPSSTHYNSVKQGQSEKSTHHVVNQSNDCITDFVEAFKDQGQAFFLDSFRMHHFENTGYELNYGTSFTEQSQLFMQNPFEDHFSQTNYSLTLND